jgi:ribosomal protein S18 acetylase RimI-like enzyme
LVDRPGEAPEGGPWVIDIFRDPNSSVTGIGRALLIAVLTAARADQLPAISLAVSHGNTRAHRLYADLGFAVAEESWTLALAKASV